MKKNTCLLLYVFEIETQWNFYFVIEENKREKRQSEKPPQNVNSLKMKVLSVSRHVLSNFIERLLNKDSRPPLFLQTFTFTNLIKVIYAFE